MADTQNDIEAQLTDLTNRHMHLGWREGRKAEIEAENEKLISEGKGPKPMEHWRPVAKPNKQGEYTPEDSEFIANLEKLDKNKQYKGLRYGENGWELDLLAFDTPEKVGKMSPYWINQNLVASKFAVGTMLTAERSGKEVDAMNLAQDVHNDWGVRAGALDDKGWHENGWSPPEQCRPFEELTDNEKDKDMANLDFVMKAAKELGVSFEHIIFPEPKEVEEAKKAENANEQQNER